MSFKFLKSRLRGRSMEDGLAHESAASGSGFHESSLSQLPPVHVLESGDDAGVLTPREESADAPSMFDGPAAAALESDSVAAPCLPLDQLQTSVAGTTTTGTLNAPPAKQGSRLDDGDPLVEFSVGGAHYVTALSTLAAVSGSAFASVVEDQQARGRRHREEGDNEDAIATFDRDGSSFRWVLIYLRWVSAGSTPPLALPQDAGDRQQLAEEAAFYGLPELESYCRRPRLSQFEVMQVSHSCAWANCNAQLSDYIDLCTRDTRSC